MAYPASVTFRQQQKSSNLWAFLTIIFVKMLLLIPYAIVLMVFSIGAFIIGFLGVFAVLLTGEYPRSFEKFIVSVMRWEWRGAVYLGCMTDKYPSFTLAGKDSPLVVKFNHQKKNSRVMALLTIIPVKFILVIPHLFIMGVMDFLAGLSYFFGVFAVLFTGHFPKPLERLIIVYYDYKFRVCAYLLCLTDKYPPLSWEDQS
jgi:uncharacterized protein DUF4389